MHTAAPRMIVLFLALAFAASAPVPGADDIQSVAAVWNDFVSALRRGDYQRAHALFSAESRSAMPYAAFVREYEPLSSARELVLARPESQSTKVDEDWAEITYAGVNPGSGRPFRVGVALARNDGGWGLVAARNEMPERIEAGARALLRMAVNWRNFPDARERLRELVEVHAGKSPMAQLYQFDTDGMNFAAIPQKPGLRTFHADAWGNIRSREYTPAGQAKAADLPLPGAPPAAPAPPPPAPREPAAGRGRSDMPELSEPPPFAAFPSLPGELAEPPLLPERAAGGGGRAASVSGARVVAEPVPVALPDTIK